MVTVFALLDSVSAGIGFAFYAGACFLASLKDDEASKSDNYLKRLKRAKRKGSRSIANYAQLLGDLILFGLSLSHALILAHVRKDHLTMRADPDVASILFGSLLWLVLLLSLTTTPDPAGIEQYTPWMIALVSYAVSIGFSIAKGYSSPANIGIQSARLLVLALLVLSIPLCRKKEVPPVEEEKQTEDETQLLISTEEREQTPTQTETENDDDGWEDDAKSISSNMSDESEKPEEENEDQKKENNQRKALRDRPGLEYLASFKIFIPFIRPRTARQYFYLSIMVLNTAAARAITLGSPLMLGAVIDDLTRHKFVLWRILTYVFLRFMASQSGVYLIRSIVSYRLNIEMHNSLITHCYCHIMELSADYHSSKSTANTWQILERGHSVVDLLQDIAFDHLPVVADLVIALFVVSHLFGAYLCFAVATTMVLLSWSNRVTLSTKTRMRRKFIEVWRNWYSHISDSFMHWRTVSEFTRIQHEKERHAEKTRKSIRLQVMQQQFRMWLSALQEVVVTVGFAFVCIIAANEIAAGRLDVGRFVVLITYWGQIMSPVTRLAGFASDISEKLVDAEKLMLLLEKQPTVTTGPRAPLFIFKGGHVKVKNASFSYDNARTVTKNVSFEALPGETVALVGETGGGKSTIFSLLYRFFDPSSGRVIVDGQDISKVDMNSYRSVLGLVPQNPVLFNTTILKNIRYSNLEATKAQVIEACKAAQFHEKVQKFPKKYMQKVGELAQKLSGGELQRLAIARAILKKPGILLLDEATSAVDSVTEAKIQEALNWLCEGRTTFVIAHRLSTIINADKILVVKNGEIVEAGTHNELVEMNGAYKELWDAQQKLSKGAGKKGKKADGSDDDGDKKDGHEETSLLDSQDLVIDEDSTSKSESSKDELHKKNDQAGSQGLAKDDDDQKSIDVWKNTNASQLERRSTGLATPPCSGEISPVKATSTAEEEQEQEYPASAAAAELQQISAIGEQRGERAATSSIKSSKSSKSHKSTASRNYGTM